MSGPQDLETVRAILGGDDAAFERLVDDLHRPLLRIAEARVGRDLAQDVVQETWVLVATHLADFEGRSALRTWITRILMNHASQRRTREHRYVPFAEGDDEGPELPFGAMGFWADTPTATDDALDAKEHVAWLREALEALPPVQRAVVTLRDVEDWTSEEVCNALELSDSNQRVLLHRGRQKLRAAVERRLGEKRRA